MRVVDEARLNLYVIKNVRMFVLTVFFATVLFNPAWASKIPFDIPSQSLDAALASFAETSGVHVLYKAEYTRGVVSNRIRGNYEPSQALTKMIEKKALTYKFTGPDSLTLKKKLFGKTSLSLKPVKDDEARERYDFPKKRFLLAESEAGSRKIRDSETEEGDEESFELKEVSVFERIKRNTSTQYKVPDASTATKTNTPIIETPMAIQVVPKLVISDQQALTLEESLNNVSGVFPTQGFGLVESFNLRGFNTFDYYRDGVRFQSALTQTGSREMANLERIEVLKGPASILFGRIEPGGMINLVTKKPQQTPYYSLQLQSGSYDLFRTTIDATGSLDQKNSLLYRFNFSHEDKGSFRQFVDNDHIFFAPVLQWKISDRTQLTVEMEYKKGKSAPDFGVPAVDGRPIDIPVERSLGESFAEAEFEEIMLGFNWSHALNDQWAVRHRFNVQFTDENDDVVVPGTLQADNRTLTRTFAGFRDNKTDTYTTSLDLIGKLEGLGAKHTLLIGGDYYNFNSRGLFISNDTFSSIDIFNPVHSGSPTKNSTSIFDSDEEWFGLYFQDQAELPHNVHLLAGFRYDFAKTASGSKTEAEQSKVSPRFGLLWRPIQELSLYSNYVENFGVPNASSSGVDGQPLKAEIANQWEAGIKTELFDGRFSATLAWFQLTKQNVVTGHPDPVLAAQNISVQTGEVRNRGIEFDITGELLPGWKVIANYAYTDSEITSVNDDTLGNRFPNVPEHAGNIWSTYAFQNRPLNGLKFGGGITVRGEREGNKENNFQMPGYTLANLMTSYAMKAGKSRITTQLNVKNLFDKKYFSNSIGFGRGRITVGAPRTFLGTLRIEY